MLFWDIRTQMGRTYRITEVSGFHIGEYEGYCLLGCCTVDVSEMLTAFIAMLLKQQGGAPGT